MSTEKTIVVPNGTTQAETVKGLSENGWKVLRNTVAGILLVFTGNQIVLGQQDMTTFLSSTNGILQGNMLSNTNVGGYRLVRIANNGGDGFSNIMIKIYDTNNNLIETVQWPSNAEGDINPGWSIEYYGNTGLGSSCSNGGKDHIVLEDDMFNTLYENPDQCVQLGPLPVELTKFVAACENDGQQVRFVELKRETASEVNNEGFWVQKSADGKTWKNIAFVPGAGTSHGNKVYTFPDKEGTDGDDDGIVYYRLEQIDLDGETNYSDKLSVRDCDSGIGYDVVLSPNPVSDILTVTLKNADNELAHTLYVFNSVGQIVGKVSASDAGKIEFDTSGILSGIYTIKAIAGNGTDVVTKMFSKI